MHRDLLEDWTVWLTAEGKSTETVRTRTSSIRSLKTHAQIADPSSVTTMQVVRWLADCVSPWTRSTYWASARQWGRWLVEEGVRDDDFMARVKRPKPPRSQPRPVSWEVVNAVLEHPPGRRAYSYLVLAVFAGLRVHEIAKVRGEDVDRDRHALYVQGKGGHTHVLPMHQLLQRLAHGQPRTGFWFPGSLDGHVRPMTVSNSIKAAFQGVGSSATAHQARHLFGTTVQRNGRDLRVTQTLMRHASPVSTAIYTDVSPLDQQAVIASLGRIA